MTIQTNLASVLQADQWMDQNLASLQAPQGTGASASASGASNAYAGLLTPDALMAYVETRLQGLNSQMQTIFQQEQATAKVTTDVDNMVGVLNSYSSGFNVSGGDSKPADYASVLPQGLGSRTRSTHSLPTKMAAPTTSSAPPTSPTWSRISRRSPPTPDPARS
jgi:hypothetical protein